MVIETYLAIVVGDKCETESSLKKMSKDLKLHVFELNALNCWF